MLPYSAFSGAKVVPSDGPYRIYGALGDAYLQNLVIKALLDRLLPLEAGERDFNLDTMDGDSTSVGDVLSRCGNLPFLAERRVVVVQRAERVEGLGRDSDDGGGKAKRGGKSSGAKETPAKRLVAGIKNLPATTVLILARTPETPEFGARKETPRCINAAIDKSIEEKDKESGKVLGLLIDCTVGAKAAQVAVAIVSNEAAQRGIPLSASAAAHLVARAGHNIAGLLNDLEKCALRAGIGQTVTAQVIDEMVKRAPQETIFDLTDALGQRQAPRALAMLRELVGNGEAPEQVLPMMVRHLRQLLQARAFLDARLPLDGSLAARMPPELAAQLPRGDNLASLLQAQSWLGARMARQAHNFTTPQLQHALQAALRTDLAMKGIEGDGGTPELLMELFVAGLC